MAPFDESASGDLFSPAGGGGGAFDVRKLWATLRRFWWVFIPSLLLAVLAALGYLKTVKPVFRSSAEIKVERRSVTAVSNSEAAALEGATTTEDLRTIERSFVSPELLKRVVTKLNLTVRDNFLGSNRPASSVGAGDLYAYLGEQAKVELVPDTRLIQVSFDSWSPEIAQEVANMLVEQGLEYDREQRIGSLGMNVRYLESEKTRLEENLKNSEEKLNEYTRQTGSVSIDDELNIIASQLRDLNARYTVAKTERLKLESDYEQIQAVRDDPDKLLSIESIRKVPAVERLYVRAGELRSQLVKLAQKYRPANPVIIQTETEIKEVDASLKQEILQAPRSIEVALAAAKRNEESLAREEAAQEKKVIETKELAVKSQVLQRQIEADRIAYEVTLKRLNVELAQVRSQPVLLQLVNPAGPGYQTSVRPGKVLAGGIIAGLLLGAGIIFLLMQTDSSVKSVEDAEAAFKLSVLSAVPEYEINNGGESKSAVPGDLAHSPVRRDRHSTAAEAFMTLRAAVQLVDDPARNGLILVTSAVPAEGKSFCALNLAVALAQSGQRTLLVDAQLRRPVLEERVFSAKGGSGLADYLQGAANFSSVIRSTDIPNLDVVTGGSPSRHPAEILSRHRFPEFLTAARTHYDRVVFDSASITSVADTLSFARFFPLVCVVLRSGRTAKGSVNRALELLNRAGAKPFGLVLNFAQDKFSFSYSGAPSTEEKSLDFPKACPSCGHVFIDFNDYLAGTRPSEKPAVAGDAGYLSRLCRQCGTAVVVSADNRRDDSQAGQQRRNLFGELHERLVRAGVPSEEARSKLLLTLKIGRHETFSDENGDTTDAGRRRHHLFDELLDQLMKTGLTREEARARLLEAIQDWRVAS